MLGQWTESEIKLLRDSVNRLGNRDLAQMLGRTVKSVKCAKSRYGVGQQSRAFRCSLISLSLRGENNPRWNGGRESARKRNNERKQDYGLEYPEKIEAKADVRRAVRHGLLLKGPCVMCGMTEGIEAHHENYDEPLNVVWLCRRHHISIHREVCNASSKGQGSIDAQSGREVETKGSKKS